jgi:hypothetical protein
VALPSRLGKRASISLGALGALLTVMALITVGCGAADPSLQFLQSQPENDLAYPGASQTSTTTEGPGFPVNTCCDVKREFSSTATAAEIANWYSAKLAQSDWASGDPPFQAGDGTTSYHWEKPALDLDIGFAPASGGETRYSVVIRSESGLYRFAVPCQTLGRTPEASLAPPGAPHPKGETFYILPGREGASLTVSQYYVLDSAGSDVLAFYDSHLSAQGWASQTVADSDFANGPVVGKWTKGTILALLGETSDRYTFELIQLVDSSGSPLPVATSP